MNDEVAVVGWWGRTFLLVVSGFISTAFAFPLLMCSAIIANVDLAANEALFISMATTVIHGAWRILDAGDGP